MRLKTRARLGAASLALGLLGLLAGCQTTPPVAWKLPEGVKTQRVNGYPMAYTEMGSGPTVVLVHGVLCDYRCFGDQQRALAAAGFRAVSISMRHFYPETWDGTGSDFTIAQHASDVAALIRGLQPPVRLVAHSYGGHVAVEVARQHPQLVSKLVLAEAPTEGLAPLGDDLMLYRRRAGENTAALYRARGVDAGLEAAVDALNGPGVWSRLPPFLKTVFRDNAWSVVGLGRDAPHFASCAEFGALKMPVLLVTGANTQPRYRELVQAQGRCLPSARTEVIPGTGHAVQMNTPVLNQVLLDFLK